MPSAIFKLNIKIVIQIQKQEIAEKVADRANISGRLTNTLLDVFLTILLTSLNQQNKTLSTFLRRPINSPQDIHFCQKKSQPKNNLAEPAKVNKNKKQQAIKLLGKDFYEDSTYIRSVSKIGSYNQFYQLKRIHLQYNHIINRINMDLLASHFQSNPHLLQLQIVNPSVCTSESNRRICGVKIIDFPESTIYNYQQQLIEECVIPEEPPLRKQPQAATPKSPTLNFSIFNASKLQNPLINSECDCPFSFQDLEMPNCLPQQLDLIALVGNIAKQSDLLGFKGKERPKKNSNAIKKIGRIILSNLHEFDIQGYSNEGVLKMMELLSKREISKPKPKKIRDSFNKSHLQKLLCSCSSETSAHNLKTLRALLNRKIRKQTFTSVQIEDRNKLLYLNTLKCSALRCCNRKLAIRLQISQSR